MRCKVSGVRSKILASSFWILVAGFCLPAHAIEFQMPIKCDLGKDCFIQNYVDTSKTPGEYKDYKCGSMTYPHHTGTDFRIPDYVRMREGVDVLAAADGKVERVRDSMADISIRQTDPATIKKAECGNAVIISHGQGWQTSYCHMKRGSIVVKPGQQVKAGEKLGQVGLSGDTEFPHVHFEVRHNGKVIDPFTQDQPGWGCNAVSGLDHSLWYPPAREKLAYNPTALLSAGFANGEPNEDAALDGQYNNLQFPPNAKFMVLWAEMMGVQKDDELMLQIIAPDGHEIFSKQADFPKNKATVFFYAGSKLLMNAWRPGTYKGRIILIRKTPSGETNTIFDETRELAVKSLTTLPE